ncbi:hypothetical protein L4174_021245 [Photobacterium sp. CCB-ST2H9]|uniref:hypothetical protein n=1 Tax=Photobacterium sp. CCB-ST2H9 TaxID=2912855 RepID=UPI002003BE08|nr:hypothetical protein [Photobacterium sp. CCB-ST2H9]UTM59234.1 hypothetical protein L4174_021245 [Photobacterium sp. CCB-ST2H9]
MNYLAVFLCPDGGIIRHQQTAEPMNIELGEFESRGEAVREACVTLECEHLMKGVISKGPNKGGFLIVDAQEFVTV